MGRFRHVLPHYGKHRRAVGLGLGALLLTNVVQQWLPLLLRHAIDDLRGGKALAVVAGWAALRAGVVLFQSWLRYGWRLRLIGSSRRVEHEVRGRLFGHVLAQARDFSLRWPLGELLTRALSDLSALREFMGRGWTFSFDALTLSVLTLLAMARLDARLALYCLLPLLLIPVVIVWVGRKVNENSRASQDALDGLALQAAESFAGARTIKAYAREQAESARFALAAALARDRGVIVARWSAFYEPLISAFSGLSLVVLFWQGGGRVLQHGMSVGTFVALLDYVLQLAGPLRQIGMTATLYQKGKASADRINEVLDEAGEPVASAPAGAPRAEAGPSLEEGLRALEWDQVWFSYSPSQPVVKGLSLKAEPGRWLGISGAVGSGKTTLLRLALRFHDPQKGALRYGGRDLRDLPLRAWREQVAWAGQDCAILSLTVAENLRLGAPNAPVGALWEVLEDADLKKEVESLPEGLDTLLGERGVNLSGGQRQRLGLARALLKPSRVWLLDDALSAVDTVVEDRILESLRRRLGSAVVILVAHRASTLAHCEAVAVLDSGILRSLGPPKDGAKTKEALSHA
jgi:ATP-binding cassette subfamily B protein